MENTRISRPFKVSLEDELRKKRAWFLLRIDEKIILKNRPQPKVPYLLGRQRTEGGWLLTNQLPPVKNGIATKDELGQYMKAFCTSWDMEMEADEIKQLVEFYAQGKVQFNIKLTLEEV